MKIADNDTDLKRGVNHIGIGVCCIVHDGSGKFLMMKRGEQARDERGNWDICGGAIEFSETIDQAIRRELQEELLTSPLSIQFAKVYDAHRMHDGKPTHWVQLIHVVQIDPATVAIGEPHKIAEIGWFTASSLPSPLHSQFYKIIDIAQTIAP